MQRQRALYASEPGVHLGDYERFSERGVLIDEIMHDPEPEHSHCLAKVSHWCFENHRIKGGLDFHGIRPPGEDQFVYRLGELITGLSRLRR